MLFQQAIDAGGQVLRLLQADPVHLVRRIGRSGRVVQLGPIEGLAFLEAPQAGVVHRRLAQPFGLGDLPVERRPDPPVVQLGRLGRIARRQALGGGAAGQGRHQQVLVSRRRAGLA